jgi:hypothetical protein
MLVLTPLPPLKQVYQLRLLFLLFERGRNIERGRSPLSLRTPLLVANLAFKRGETGTKILIYTHLEQVYRLMFNLYLFKRGRNMERGLLENP